MSHCFFASLGHALYNNPNCHLDIHRAGNARHYTFNALILSCILKVLQIFHGKIIFKKCHNLEHGATISLFKQ